MKKHVRCETDLKLIAAILHDARFTADAIGFDATMGTFSMKCWVFQHHKEERTNRRLWAAYQLSIANVVNCDVHTLEIVPYYELSTIRLSDSGRRLELLAQYGIDISLQISEIGGTLEELDETRGVW